MSKLKPGEIEVSLGIWPIPLLIAGYCYRGWEGVFGGLVLLILAFTAMFFAAVLARRKYDK